MQKRWLIVLLKKSVAPLWHGFGVMILVCWISWTSQLLNLLVFLFLRMQILSIQTASMLVVV
jgi:hypothetical protein